MSENLADNSTLVVNENDFFRSARKGLGGLTLRHLGGPYYSEGDDEYGNSFQAYLASRHPSSANNIFFHLLRPWMGTETAVRWGMRLLPLEIMGLGAAGWFAQGWAQPLMNGMLALDPTMMGALLMGAGILAFRFLHLALDKIWGGKHPGLSPPENRFWSNTARMMIYAFLPFLVASPALFALAFSVFAYDHFAYDRQQLFNKKTPFVSEVKRLAIRMASAQTPAPVVQNSQTPPPIQQQLVREAVLNLITGDPLLRIPDQIRPAEKFTPNIFKGIAQADMKTAISDLEDQNATNRAAKNFGRLLGETNGPHTRITMNFLGFHNWPENIKATAQAVLAGMLGENQPVLIVSEVSTPAEILRQVGVTHDQEVLVKTYINANVYTTINEVERNNNNDIPLSAIVLVQEGAKNFIGENKKYKGQYFERIANSINKEIQALLAALRAA
ncbi:MAG: hypothetical protein IPN90_00825 [Elusimicrobia bacterium]|nr:hypothetical protein [Elusimicrobiota bacterium]